MIQISSNEWKKYIARTFLDLSTDQLNFSIRVKGGDKWEIEPENALHIQSIFSQEMNTLFHNVWQSSVKFMLKSHCLLQTLSKYC